MVQWFLSLPIQIQAALIGTTTTIVVLFLREMVFQIWHEKREARKNTLTIYRKYADPLASASVSLLWRLNEIFYQEGRGAFLKAQEPRTKFESYKRRSTLYRLGALMGWIRAFRRELSFLTTNNREQLPELENAIFNFEAALADGPHIEIERVEGLTKLWEIDLPKEPEKVSAIAVHLEQLIKRRLHTSNIQTVTLLTEQDQIDLCKQTADLICDHLKINSLNAEIIRETRARAIQRMAIREAWLYRDWQAGIGDLMIYETSTNDRRFEVIGYRGFETMLCGDNEEQKRWLQRLTNVVDDLDISGADRFDARTRQLRNTMVASAQIVKALAKVTKRYSGINSKTLELAQKIIDDNQQRT